MGSSSSLESIQAKTRWSLVRTEYRSLINCARWLKDKVTEKAPSNSTIWEPMFKFLGDVTVLAFKERRCLSPSLASQDKSLHLILTLNKNSISSLLECKTVNLSKTCSFHYVKRSTHYNQDKRMWIRQIDHHFKCINQLATLVTSQNRTVRHLFCLTCVSGPSPGGHRISAPPYADYEQTAPIHCKSSCLLSIGLRRLD